MASVWKAISVLLSPGPGIYDVAIVNAMTHSINGKDLSKNLVRVDNAIKLIFLTPTNEGNKEINTVTSNHFWIIRKPITIENLWGSNINTGVRTKYPLIMNAVVLESWIKWVDNDFFF